VGRMVAEPRLSDGSACISISLSWVCFVQCFYFTGFPSSAWRVAERAISQRRLTFLPGGNGGNELVSVEAGSRTVIGTGDAVLSHSTFVSGTRLLVVELRGWTDVGWSLICGQDGAVLGSLYLETIGQMLDFMLFYWCGFKFDLFGEWHFGQRIRGTKRRSRRWSSGKTVT
jgi:hypothetical protein